MNSTSECVKSKKISWEKTCDTEMTENKSNYIIYERFM